MRIIKAGHGHGISITVYLNYPIANQEDYRLVRNFLTELQPCIAGI